MKLSLALRTISNKMNRIEKNMYTFLLAELLEAVRINDAQLVRRLLENGVDPNGYEDRIKVTPLHYAAQAGAYEICMLLLAAGANKYAKTLDGDMPLDMLGPHYGEHIYTLLGGNKSKNPVNEDGRSQSERKSHG